MRSVIKYIDPTYVLVDKNGIPKQHFRIFLQEVFQNSLLIGEGDPNGVIEAPQGREYMNEIGTPGSVKWIKQLADVGGDKSLGWVAIG